MRYRNLICTSLLLASFSALLKAQNAEPSPILAVMKAELGRSLQTLKSQPLPPYYLSYEITDDQVVEVNGSFGEITSSVRSQNRQLDIDLHVGDYRLDNTHLIATGFPEFNFFERMGFIQVPLDDNPEALRSIIWYHTDRKYKAAVEQYTKVKTAVQVAVSPEDKSDDFSRGPAAAHLEKTFTLSVDPKVWEEKIRKYTAPLARYGNLYEAQAYFNADI